MRFSPEKLLSKLPKPGNAEWTDGVPFENVFEKGNFTLEFFALSGGTDYQKPHEQDEFYIIASGTADLIIENERFECNPGDALFVQKGAAHRFENNSEDFATWVIFF